MKGVRQMKLLLQQHSPDSSPNHQNVIYIVDKVLCTNLDYKRHKHGKIVRLASLGFEENVSGRKAKKKQKEEIKRIVMMLAFVWLIEKERQGLYFLDDHLYCPTAIQEAAMPYVRESAQVRITKENPLVPTCRGSVAARMLKCLEPSTSVREVVTLGIERNGGLKGIQNEIYRFPFPLGMCLAGTDPTNTLWLYSN